MGFAEDLKKFSNICEKKATTRLRKIGIVALKKLVLRTPVKTGCARSNWNVKINEEDLSFDPEAKGQSGGVSISRGTPIVLNTNLGSVINIANACPYIVSLERGHSRQRPGGFLKLCQVEVQNLIDSGTM